MARDSASPLEDARLLVGRYRLEQEIGRGGMGVVYRGVDTTIERPVAVKLLRSSTAAEHPSTQRFLHEAKNAARIQHPHVIQVFDVGRSETGEPFFVMELVEGLPLSQLLQNEGAIPAPRAAHIGMQICEALHAAHRAGIVHRDLKLANVLLVEREGEGDFVKLIDFGISRASDRARVLTNAGETIGTIGYMAPEQLLHEPIDGRTDVYAFGVLLYRLITDRPLFRDGSAASLARDHLTVVPVAPHLRVPEAGIPEALSAVILRCLEKRPRDRFPSARAVAQALRAAIDPDAPDSSPPSSRALPPLRGPGFAVTTSITTALPDAQDPGPLSLRGGRGAGSIGERGETLPMIERTPEPADSTLPTLAALGEGVAGELGAEGVGEEASLEELPPSESGARRTPELALLQRQRAAPPAPRPSGHAAAPAPRSVLPEPMEPPPSSRGARLAQPPPEPPPSHRPARVGRGAPGLLVSARAPASSRAGAPGSSRAGAPGSSRVGAPASSRAGAPASSRAGAAPPSRPEKVADSPVDPPSGTRRSPTDGRRSGPTFELAEVPATVRPPPSSTAVRRCASCNAVNDRYARLCKSCASPFDPASGADLREPLAALDLPPRVTQAPARDRGSLPLGPVTPLFRWAPSSVWTAITALSALGLVAGELLLTHHGPAMPLVLGALLAAGVCGMVANR